MSRLAGFGGGKEQGCAAEGLFWRRHQKIVPHPCSSVTSAWLREMRDTAEMQHCGNVPQTEKKKKKGKQLRGGGELMEGRDGADIPLLGCSMRIHVPCCFTMEEKQHPPPAQTGRGASRGSCRGEAEHAAWGGGGVCGGMGRDAYAGD